MSPKICEVQSGAANGYVTVTNTDGVGIKGGVKKAEGDFRFFDRLPIKGGDGFFGFDWPPGVKG